MTVSFESTSPDRGRIPQEYVFITIMFHAVGFLTNKLPTQLPVPR